MNNTRRKPNCRILAFRPPGSPIPKDKPVIIPLKPSEPASTVVPFRRKPTRGNAQRALLQILEEALAEVRQRKAFRGTVA